MVKPAEVKEKIEDIYAQSIGTEHYYRDAFTQLINTDGVQEIAEVADAHWLISDIGVIAMMGYFKKPVPFQIWILSVAEDASAILICKEDTDEPVIYRQEYVRTDFPPGEWKFYVVNGVMMLPGEY